MVGVYMSTLGWVVHTMVGRVVHYHGRGAYEHYGVRGGGYQDEPSRKLQERKYLKLNFPKYFPYSAQSMINPIGKNNWQQEYVQSNTTLFKRRNATRSNSRESSLPCSHFPGELSTTVAAQIWPLARERKRQTTAIRYNGKMQRRYVQWKEFSKVHHNRDFVQAAKKILTVQTR